MQIAFAYNLWLYFTAATNPDSSKKNRSGKMFIHNCYSLDLFLGRAGWGTRTVWGNLQQKLLGLWLFRGRLSVADSPIYNSADGDICSCLLRPVEHYLKCHSLIDFSSQVVYQRQREGDFKQSNRWRARNTEGDFDTNPRRLSGSFDKEHGNCLRQDLQPLRVLPVLLSLSTIILSLAKRLLSQGLGNNESSVILIYSCTDFPKQTLHLSQWGLFSSYINCFRGH